MEADLATDYQVAVRITLLFSIVMDVIISKVEARGNISTRLKQIAA
jgi:hypothetical protein